MPEEKNDGLDALVYPIISMLRYSGKNSAMMEGLKMISVFHEQSGIDKYLTGIELYNNGWRSPELDAVIGA